MAEHCTEQGLELDGVVQEQTISCCVVQDLLEEVETHEEILKLLLTVCAELSEDQDQEEEDRIPVETVKQLQTSLYKLWLRTLEWECLLEQQLGHCSEVRQYRTFSVVRTGCNSCRCD